MIYMSKRSGGLTLVAGLVVAVATIYYAVCWPYLLGTWIATRLDLSRPVLGWLLEVTYLLAVPAAVWLVRAGRPGPRGLRRIAEAPLAVLTIAVLTGGVLLVL